MSAFTCPHCGGPIAYNTAVDAMSCTYCDSTITLDDYRKHLSTQNKLLLNELSCPQCGGQLLTSDATAATFCSYCGSSVALQSRMVEEDQPHRIIPFKIDEQLAQDIYKYKINSTLLAPDWMRSEDATSHFRGIYMPFHVYGFRWKGTWEGQTTDISTRKIGGTTYDITRVYDTGANVLVDYQFLPQDASAGFPDSMSRAVCPFNRKNERDFVPSYYAGFYADRGDVHAGLYVEKMADLVKDDVAEKGTVHCGKVQVSTREFAKDMDLHYKTQRTMFPIWFLTLRKDDKVNYACVNGDTGELVCDIPMDFKKYLMVSVVVAALISLVLNIFLVLKPSNMLLGALVLGIIAFFMANSLLNSTYRRIMHWDDPGYTGVDVDRVDQNTFRQKKAPFSYKIKVLFKPLLAIAASIVVFLLFSEVDELCYGAAVAGIAMIIWTAFDIVKTQNRFTMRDLPLFNEKRGGEA